MARSAPVTPRFHVNQHVRVREKTPIRTVAACYKVEIWWYYELTGIPGYLIKDELLEDAEPQEEQEDGR